MTDQRATRAQQWAGPIALAMISALALYIALIYDGWADVLCGLVLLAVGAYGLMLLRRRS
ncbi:MAG: hypothetical protein AAGG11_15170 [Pseudomonadota bacterium]